MKILFVDDEPQQGPIETIRNYMDYYVLELRESEKCPYEVTVSNSPDDALDQLSHTRFDLAILDSMMPIGKYLTALGSDAGEGIWTGIPLARVIHEKYPNLPIFLLSNLASKGSIFEKVLAEGVVARVLFKLDNTPEDLLDAVNKQLATSEGGQS